MLRQPIFFINFRKRFYKQEVPLRHCVEAFSPVINNPVFCWSWYWTDKSSSLYGTADVTALRESGENEQAHAGVIVVEFRRCRRWSTAAIRASGRLRRRPSSRSHASSSPRQEEMWRGLQQQRRQHWWRDVIALCVDAWRHRFRCRRLRQQQFDGVVDGGRCGRRRVFVRGATSRSSALRQHRFSSLADLALISMADRPVSFKKKKL